MTEYNKPPLSNFFNGSLVSLQGHDDKAQLVNVDQIIANVLQESSLEKAKEVCILRFDKMPLIYGDESQLKALFGKLVSMIVQHPPANTKLILYVQCKEEENTEEVMDLRSHKEGRYFKIDFHTNIKVDEIWKQLYQSELLTCHQLAMQNGGSFCYHVIINTGCLFSLILPGKN